MKIRFRLLILKIDSNFEEDFQRFHMDNVKPKKCDQAISQDQIRTDQLSRPVGWTDEQTHE